MLDELTAGAPVEDWTEEQEAAISRREGELFLDAAAGSGKTSVLVERFVRGVLEDGVDVAAILTITFTDRAAAEMRERIRNRLRELGAMETARATERAFISTIHGFCARVLRTHALAAGVDPAFSVLDAGQAALLADRAFEESLEAFAERDPAARELISAYGPWELRAATLGAYAQLRSRGQVHPQLPQVPATPGLEALHGRVKQAATVALRELGTVDSPSERVVSAIDRLARVEDLRPVPAPWPGAVEMLRLPGGNGAALRTEACAEYAEALDELRAGCAQAWAREACERLGRLLERFGATYERRKRERSAIDFADLELSCLSLLRARPELRERYRERFTRVMVDEMQDTNRVQLELIESIADGNLFTVGDAQQSIYGFRHADVELFRRRGNEMEQRGRRQTLQVNFRTRPEIVAVLNRVFSSALGEDFRPLVPGRTPAEAGAPLVELLVVDRGQGPGGEEPAISWRVAEARLLAERVAELIQRGGSPRDVVVLTRATTDMRVYEQALEARGVPTYVIGGRGYWAHPQVLDVVAYLRVLANPRDEEALYTVLASPVVGLSYDALVLLAAAARDCDRDPWWILREPSDRLAELGEEDRRRAERFMGWAVDERDLAARKGVEELIQRMLERTGYDLGVMSLPGGQRRLANVRKLMRLGREHLALAGPDLRGFLELAAERARGLGGEEESEAPVEGEALDAVRLMTIHRAKGLEFDVVCVADLGRAPRSGGELLRIGEGDRLGVRLSRPGTGRREPALEYEVLGEEQREHSAGEERRIFYVAATRARERLIFSGAADVQAVWQEGRGTAPIAWLGPALMPELPATGEGGADDVRVVIRPVEGDAREDDPVQPLASLAPLVDTRETAPLARQPPPRGNQPRMLSYTALAEFKRCGYRFYVERLLGLPPVEPTAGEATTPSGAGLAGAERGTIVHALLERIDFRRPVAPDTEAVAAAAGRRLAEADSRTVAALIEAFTAGELCARLGEARSVQREQPFAFELDGTLITGALDVIAWEPEGRALVVDYKTDRLEGRDPAEVVAGAYAVQRLIYAVAALRDRAAEVEVVHVFLERPNEPAVVRYTRAELVSLEAELGRLVSEVRGGVYRVSDTPHRELCAGCPAEGGLCSWPLAATRRDSPERLF